MSATEQQVETAAPFGIVSTDEKPAGFCEVIYVLPSLAVARCFSAGKFQKRPSGGSTVDVSFDETSFMLTASVVEKSKQIKYYKERVKQLPAAIDPDKSYFKVKEGQVRLYLKKVDPKSWAGPLSQHGIDQSPPDLD